MGRRRGGGTNQARDWDQAQVQVQEQEWIVLGAQKYRGRVDGRLGRWVQEGLRWLALAWPALPDSV